MIIKQISVYLENKSGKLLDFVDLMADNGIDLQAMSIADTQDFGILRVIVDKPDEASKLLKDNNYSVTETEVISVDLEDKPGSMRTALKVLDENNISLAYSYAFMTKKIGKACIVMRVDNNEEAVKLLNAAGITA